MSVVKSVDIIVKIGGTTILGQRGCKMTSTRDKTDLTVKANYPDKVHISSWNDASIDCDGLLHVAGGGIAELYNQQLNDTPVTVLITVGASGESFTGAATISDISFDAPQDKEPTMSCKLDKTGAWVATVGS